MPLGPPSCSTIQFTGRLGIPAEILCHDAPPLNDSYTLPFASHPENVTHTCKGLEASTAIAVMDTNPAGSPAVILLHEPPPLYVPYILFPWAAYIYRSLLGDTANALMVEEPQVLIAPQLIP